MTGLGDRHHPEYAIDITGIRNMTVQVADKAQVHDFCISLLDAQPMPTGHRHQGSAIQLFTPYIHQYCRNNPGRPLRNECLEAVNSFRLPAVFAALHRM